jgi:CheY-like chemotaxis protein
MLRTAFPESEIETHTAINTAEALDIFFRMQPQAVLLEMDSPAIDGNEVFHRFVAADPAVDVILVARQYSASAAVEAIRFGATDFFSKPLDVAKLQAKLRGIIADAARRKEALSLDRELIENYSFEGIIGRSPEILDIFSRIRRVAPHFRVLLIHGETGTGKELVRTRFTTEVQAPKSHSLPVTAQPSSILCWKLNSSDMSKVPLLALIATKLVCSNTRQAELYSSTRSGICPWVPRPNCCGFCKITNFIGLVLRRFRISMSVSSRPRTAICRRWSHKASFAKTYITA